LVSTRLQTKKEGRCDPWNGAVSVTNVVMDRRIDRVGDRRAIRLEDLEHND
jgi:hypothetical protein